MFERPRWGLYSISKALLIALSVAPFVTNLPWEAAALSVAAIDNLDGALIHGIGGREFWRRYRRMERWTDTLSFFPLAVFPLYSGILSEVRVLFIAVLVAWLLFAIWGFKEGEWGYVLKPASMEFFVPVAIASLAGFDLSTAGIFGMAVSPLIQIHVHGFRWKLPVEQTALAGFLASSFWLGIASALMGEWHTILFAIPILTLFWTIEWLS